MKQPETRHEVECTEPSERLRQAVRLLYEYVLQRKHASSVGKSSADNYNKHEDSLEDRLKSMKH